MVVVFFICPKLVNFNEAIDNICKKRYLKMIMVEIHQYIKNLGVGD